MDVDRRSSSLYSRGNRSAISSGWQQPSPHQVPVSWPQGPSAQVTIYTQPSPLNTISSIDSSSFGSHSFSYGRPGSSLSNPSPLHPLNGPPTLNHWRSPHRTIPLPSPHYRVFVSHILQVSQTPLIQWDPTSHPSTARCLEQSDGTQAWLVRPASSPGQTSLTFRTALVDRPILAFARDHEYVTIGDVLSVIYEAIHKALLLPTAINEPSYATNQSPPPASFAHSILGMPDHNHGQGGRLTQFGPLRWGGMVESPTESMVWILLLH